MIRISPVMSGKQTQHSPPSVMSTLEPDIVTPSSLKRQSLQPTMSNEIVHDSHHSGQSFQDTEDSMIFGLGGLESTDANTFGNGSSIWSSKMFDNSSSLSNTGLSNSGLFATTNSDDLNSAPSTFNHSFLTSTSETPNNSSSSGDSSSSSSRNWNQVVTREKPAWGNTSSGDAREGQDPLSALGFPQQQQQQQQHQQQQQQQQQQQNIQQSSSSASAWGL
jgi:hypothetical protein